MSHRFVLRVEVELERSTGHFASRDDMAEALVAEVEGAYPSGLYGIGSWGDGDYDVTDFTVEEDTSDDTIKALRKKAKALEAEIVRITKAQEK